MPPASLRTVRTRDPINWRHPLNRGRVLWLYGLPGISGGRQWFDLCGKNHMALTNGPAWALTPRGDAALNLDGVDDCAVNPSCNFGLDGGIELSAAINCRASSLTATTYLFYKHIDYTSDQTYRTFGIYVTAAGAVGAAVENAAKGMYPNWVSAGGVIATGKLVRLLMSWRRASGGAADMAVYLDGAPLSLTFTANGYSAAFTAKETPHNLSVGARYVTAYSSFFAGQVGDFTVWNRGVAAADARQDSDLSRRNYPGVLKRRGNSLLTLGSPYRPWWAGRNSSPLGSGVI